jgi:hypothetical protein
MALQLALDPITGDLIKQVGGGVQRVSDGRYTVQACQSRLRTHLGEWALAPDHGWINLTDFVKNYDLFDLEMRARVIILATQGVQEITELSLVVNKRILTLSFKALTVYGEINLTVPWST